MAGETQPSSSDAQTALRMSSEEEKAVAPAEEEEFQPTVPPPAPTDAEAAGIDGGALLRPDELPASVPDTADAEPPADVSEEPPPAPAPAPAPTPDGGDEGGEIVVASSEGEAVAM